MNRSTRARLISIPGTTALILALFGCGSDKSGSAPDTQLSPPPPPAAFTASLGAASVMVSQGSRAGVWVNITRDSSFTGAVTVTLDTPPAGVRPFTLTIASLSTAGLYQVRSAPDLAVGGPIALTLVASGGGSTVRLPVTATVTAARPSSESLIAADLGAGTIDYATSLLYRAYARFHDPRLPTQYAGSANARDDGFFVEASNPALSAAVQAAMQPYVARPTDTTSWFQQSATAHGAGRARANAHAVSGSPASPCTLTDGEVEYQGWKSLLLPIIGGGSLRFWVACNSELGFDDTTLAYMSSYAGPVADAEVALMGPPVGDLGGLFFGTDSAIDVYLIDDCQQDAAPRADGTTLCDKEENTGSVSGAAIATISNASGNACSDFIIIDRAEIDGGSYKSTFAHEFFHVLQDAYACRLGESDGTGEYWFREASATWAEANFVPETAVAEVHHRFVDDFQKSTESLHQSNGADADHIYSAYIWPFFFDQKKGGGAESVQAAWNSLRGAISFDAANQALDTGVYNFKTNFRDFAVTNLNVPRPDALPDSALYSVTSPTVKKLTFNFSGIQVRDGLDIDALVQINGQPWARRHYDDADTVKFCLDKPDQNLTDSIWVLSNHNVPFDQVVTGLVKVEASEVACGKSWSGQANSDFGDTMHAVVTWVFDDQHSTDTVAVFYPTGTVSFNAPGCTVNPGSSAIGQGEGSLRIDYSTTPPTYQLSGATVWLATWQCGGNTFQASTGGFWLADFNKTPPYATGTVPAVDKNGNIVLSGTNNSTGYTFGWTFTDD